MDWLLFTLFVEMGLLKESILADRVYYAYPPDAMYTDLGIDIQALNFIGVSASIKTDILPGQESIYFTPIHTEYEISGYIFYGPLEIGVRHMCSHPVWTSSLKASGRELFEFEQSYTQIYARLELTGKNK